MSESLRDRVARVLYEVAPIRDVTLRRDVAWEEVDADGRQEHYLQADALIAAGLVASLEDAGMQYGNKRTDGTGMTARDYRKSEAESLQAARSMPAVQRCIYASDWEPVDREALVKLSDARLAELEALLASSTPGRWEAEGYDVYAVDTKLGEVVAEMGMSSIDGKLIAASHEALPALLAEVRSSRAALARIASAYNNPGSHPDYHERVKSYTRRDWPTLTAAIEAAIR